MDVYNTQPDLYDFHHKPLKRYFSYRVELYEGYKHQWEIHDWCDETFGLRSNIAESRWYISATGCGELFFWSKTIEDCMAFKLRWL